MAAIDFSDKINRNCIDGALSGNNGSYVVCNCSRTQPHCNGRRGCKGCKGKCVDYYSFGKDYIWIGKPKKAGNPIVMGDIGTVDCHIELWHDKDKHKLYIEIHFEDKVTYLLYEKALPELAKSNCFHERYWGEFRCSDSSRTPFRVIRLEECDADHSDFVKSNGNSGIDYDQIGKWVRKILDENKGLIDGVENEIEKVWWKVKDIGGLS